MKAEAGDGAGASDTRTVLGGRYRLVELSARDGTGALWRGHDEIADRPVMVHLLPFVLTRNPSFASRLQRRAQTFATVAHPHIVPVFDHGFHPRPYLVAGLVEGAPLDAGLAERPLEAPAAVRLAMQVSEALSALHARGVAHGNLTPASIVLTATGAQVTCFSAIETIEQSSDDVAVDVMALGIVLYRSLVGDAPNRATDGSMSMAPLQAVPGLPSVVVDQGPGKVVR